MLDELRVTNLGIIAEAAIEPGPGLVVVTGETGAGKTLLLGALRLLTGEATRRDQVGPQGAAAEVAGRFVVKEVEFVASRRVLSEGRSRAYLDGEMVPAMTLQDRTGGVVEIVSQHDHMVVSKPAGIRSFLDAALEGAGGRALAAYRQAWAVLEAVRIEATQLGGDRRVLERELDMVRFQADEIAASGFAAGDDEQLAASANRLRNHEALAESLAAAGSILGSDSATVTAVESGLAELTRAARLDPELAGLASMGDQLSEAVTEISRELASAVVGVEHEPGLLDDVEQRLAVLGDLRRKYGDTLTDVIDFGARAATRAGELESLLATADDLEERFGTAIAAVGAAGAVLTKYRLAAADRIAADTVEHLIELGFRNPVVDFAFEGIEPTATGTERIQLMFASDASLTPGPVGRVASGGELSRLVLALRLSAGVTDVPVVAFDEIDAGIGGSTALVMGRKLAGLAAGRQVLCVTHLPQVAAFADRHFVVSRTETTAEVEQVEGDRRLEELARMLAGMPESERGLAHAEELLRQVRS